MQWSAVMMFTHTFVNPIKLFPDTVVFITAAKMYVAELLLNFV